MNWCLPWARWRAGDGWITDCGKAGGAVEQERCDAVSLTVQSPPPEGTRSVLDESLPAGGAAPVRCERFADRAAEDEGNADRWTAKQHRCEAVRASLLPFSSLKPAGCKTLDVGCKVGEQIKDVARSGFEGLADIAVAGFAWMLSKLAEVVFEQSSAVPDEPFYGVYNDISGVLIVVVLLFFLISTAISGLRLNGPGPLSSLGGLVRAMFGIAFAGGIAYILMAAWDEATVALIARNQQRDWQPSMWVDALNALTADTGTILLAFVVAVISVIGLVLVFVMLLFRSLLAAGAALFGAMAMTGQVMAETRSWGRKWFWTCNALASSKFFIAALWIYGTRSAYESDNVINVLRGMFIIILMVLAPWILLRLTSMWDGYLADVDARGFLVSAAGAVGMDAAARRLTDPLSGGGDGGGGPEAASLMQGNSDAIPTIPTGDAGPSTGGPSAVPEAVDALHAGGDAEQVGQPTGEPDGGHNGGENADEVEGIERDSRTAQSDVANGQLTAPGDATGQSALPVTPPAIGEKATGADTPPTSNPDNAGPAQAPTGGDTAGSTGPTAAGLPLPPAPTPESSEHHPSIEPPGSGQPSTGGTGPGAAGPGGAGSGAGGAGGAAAGGAAELPIIPV
ncbi:hypothetical protein [Micromonospora endolithica]|uniref:Type IV secretion system protein n=1 Tax=Micromonospora endolithica TaxID=230091 RepID=A0A3A9ZQG5_9ACTN|nr:hypothetical protein [Micromonospora endolithica]RKN50492.1 hypothetical protein D7223_01475 [Micromonospora endolithica]TWJ20816.1 hypothetical protein JD76_00916 [Micromonospora endolithica]